MLIELPNGDHVDPAVVTGIVPLAGREADRYTPRLSPRVIVHWGAAEARNTSLLTCESDAEAAGLARSLAEQVNGAEVARDAAQPGEAASGTGDDRSWMDRPSML